MVVVKSVVARYLLSLLLIVRAQLAPVEHAFLLHAAVLEPYLHLPVAEANSLGDLLPHLAADELVRSEFPFQLGQLVLGVRPSAPTLMPSSSDGGHLGGVMMPRDPAWVGGVMGVVGMVVRRVPTVRYQGNGIVRHDWMDIYRFIVGNEILLTFDWSYTDRFKCSLNSRTDMLKKQYSLNQVVLLMCRHKLKKMSK